jgi:hypothetical protein
VDVCACRNPRALDNFAAFAQDHDYN